MRILGIETSCDETAAAVVDDGRRILSSIVSSQIKMHAKYGGVVPELASREHLRNIGPVVAEAMSVAGSTWADLDAIAVTQGPGLVGSLLVGMTYAKSLCLARRLPLVAVNHIEGHVHAVALETGSIDLPAIALIVSGGHTHLYHVGPEFQYRLLGRTRDDAAGEAYDKVAKLLGYSYPGGPILDALAAHGNPSAVRFSLAKMKGNTLDFSFSGLKTAVLRWVEEHDMAAEIAARKALKEATKDDYLRASPKATLDLIASFQKTVIEELLRRVMAVAEDVDAQSLVVSGGVACNAGLRQAARSARLPFPVHFPSVVLSTDNAAMIAAAGYPKAARGEFANYTLKAQATLALGEKAT